MPDDRSTTIETYDGLLTNTKWFSQIKPDGDKIVMVTDPDIGEVQSIVLAVVPDPAERDALYDEMTKAVGFEKRRLFQVALSDTALAE